MYRSLERKGYFAVVVSKGRIRLQAKGFIGVIPINDRLTLEVAPRVPLGNMSRLLDVARYAPVTVANAYRLYETEGEMFPSLAVVYAAALRDELDRIGTLGWFKEYHRVEELTSFPRGRLNATRTMQVAAGRDVSHKAVSGWSQRSVDNPLNRCLLLAVWRLHQYLGQVADTLHSKVRRRAAADVNRSWHLLQGVRLDPAQRFAQDGRVTGRQPLPSLRAYYQPALALAMLIIGREALRLEQSAEGVRLPSMVVDMTDVFEAYVRNLLSAIAAMETWKIEVLDGNRPAPGGGQNNMFDARTAGTPGMDVTVSPDVVLRRGHTFPGLLEVKYKPAAGQPDKDDLNQTVAYAFAYRSPRAMLVQPRAHNGPPAGLERLGTISGVILDRYILDLSAKSLESAEADFATAVRSLI